MNKEIEYNREENLFQAYLSRIITSVFEAGLVEREKRFMPQIIRQELRNIVNHIRKQERQRIIEEIEKMERIPVKVDKDYDGPDTSETLTAGYNQAIEDIIKNIK